MATKIERVIPKTLQVDGVQVGHRKKSLNESRLVLTGRPGTGKSTLAHSNPKAIILDPEDGGATVADPQALRFTPSYDLDYQGQVAAYKEFLEKVIQLRLSGDHTFETVGIDTFDKLLEVWMYAFCDEHRVESPGDYGGGHGKGYAVIREELFRYMDRLTAVGYGICILAHVSPKTIRSGKEEVLVHSLSCSDSFSTALFKNCEHMLFMEHATIQEKGTPRTKTLPGGKVIELDAPVTNKRVRLLRSAPGGLWRGGVTDDVKTRVPLDAEIVIPSTGGWACLEEKFDEAMAKLGGS